MSLAPLSTAVPHSVVVVIFPAFQLLDASGPLEVFSAAATLQPAPLPYRVRVVSVAGGAVQSGAGLAVLSEPLPEPHSLAGCTLILVGGFGVLPAAAEGSLLRWLVLAAPRASRCCSVCTGAFLLAQAGLLDGRTAVTHWRYAAALRRYYPKVRVLDDALFIKDGPIYSSAGVTAGIDLCLSLVEEDLGRALALRVAKELVVHLKRAGGQRQFSAELLAQTAPECGLIADLSAWLKSRLQQPLNVELMAQAVAVSPRTLHRRCQAELAMTPAQYLLRLRLEAACRLLEGGTISLKRIALLSGFGSEYNLRRAFVQGLQVTPSEYRLRFCR
ncbi:MAG: GlxA family transcriptional regulator [Pseudomonas sp.]|uniref:GlxA family transcriptional regulator n=1 Tax=Pseudomonas sp. TaxID=306 RepID=UPI003392FAFD